MTELTLSGDDDMTAEGILSVPPAKNMNFPSKT